MYFTKETGGGKRLENGHINFESMWRYGPGAGSSQRSADESSSVTAALTLRFLFLFLSLTNRLADFMVFKSSRAHLQRLDDVIRYLKTIPVWTEYGVFRRDA